MITDLEPDILECEVKWALGSISENKASGGDRIPAELFQILKDKVVKELHSICHQIWKTQQQLQDQNCKLPDVQAGFRKGRGTVYQIGNIRWIIKKVREFQKNIYFFY